MNNKPDFTLDEYKICKQQIADAIKAMDQLEIFVVGAIAAVYVYVFTQASSNLVPYVMLVPVFLALAGALRTSALDDTIGIFNDYNQVIENRNPGIRFTTYYRANRTAKMKWSRYIVWGTLIIGTSSLAALTIVAGPSWIKGDTTDLDHKKSPDPKIRDENKTNENPQHSQ